MDLYTGELLGARGHALYAPLPEWAQPSLAVLHYALHRRSQPWFWRCLSRSGGLLAIWGLVAISWLAYRAHSPLAVNTSCGSALFAVLYFPALILQFVALMVALLWASDIVTTERRRGTWEMFRVTSHGPEMLCFARWVAVFHQMRTLLVLLIVPRVLLAGLMLVDVAGYQGHRLDFYATWAPSPVPLSVAVIALAALTFAALIQLPVLIGLNAALGVLISAAFRRQAVAGLARVVVFAAEIGLFGLALRALRSTLESDPGGLAAGRTVTEWSDLLLIGTLGDQGLRFMDLRTLLETWIDVDCGMLLGGALLILTIVQALMTREALVIAARLAARPVSE
jgi:hypothetical protein